MEQSVQLRQDLCAAVAEMQVATRVILISVFGDEARSEKAAAVGAHGFVPKDELASSLLLAIETVHRGELYFPG